MVPKQLNDQRSGNDLKNKVFVGGEVVKWRYFFVVGRRR